MINTSLRTSNVLGGSEGAEEFGVLLLEARQLETDFSNHLQSAVTGSSDDSLFSKPKHGRTSFIANLIFSLSMVEKKVLVPVPEDSNILIVRYCGLMSRFYASLDLCKDELEAFKWKDDIFRWELTSRALATCCLYVLATPAVDDTTDSTSVCVLQAGHAGGGNCITRSILPAYNSFIHYDEEDNADVDSMLACSHAAIIFSPSFGTNFRLLRGLCIGTARSLYSSKIGDEENSGNEKKDLHFKLMRFIFLESASAESTNYVPKWLRNGKDLQMEKWTRFVLNFLAFPFEGGSNNEATVQDECQNCPHGRWVNFPLYEDREVDGHGRNGLPPPNVDVHSSRTKQLLSRAGKLRETFRRELDDHFKKVKLEAEFAKVIKEPEDRLCSEIVVFVFSIEAEKLPMHAKLEDFWYYGRQYCALLRDFYTLLNKGNRKELEIDIDGKFSEGGEPCLYEQCAEQLKKQLFCDSTPPLQYLALTIFALFVRGRRYRWRKALLWKREEFQELKSTFVFLSHRGTLRDKDAVECAYEYLEASRTHLDTSRPASFFDEHSIKCGVSNELQIQVALLYSKKVAVVATPVFPTSEWPLMEYCIGSVRYLHLTHCRAHLDEDSVVKDDEDDKDTMFDLPRFIFFDERDDDHKAHAPVWISTNADIHKADKWRDCVLSFMPFPFEGSAAADGLSGWYTSERASRIFKIVRDHTNDSLSKKPASLKIVGSNGGGGENMNSVISSKSPANMTGDKEVKCDPFYCAVVLFDCVNAKDKSISMNLVETPKEIEGRPAPIYFPLQDKKLPVDKDQKPPVDKDQKPPVDKDKNRPVEKQLNITPLNVEISVPSHRGRKMTLVCVTNAGGCRDGPWFKHDVTKLLDALRPQAVYRFGIRVQDHKGSTSAPGMIYHKTVKNTVGDGATVLSWNREVECALRRSFEQFTSGNLGVCPSKETDECLHGTCFKDIIFSTLVDGKWFALFNSLSGGGDDDPWELFSVDFSFDPKWSVRQKLDPLYFPGMFSALSNAKLSSCFLEIKFDALEAKVARFGIVMAKNAACEDAIICRPFIKGCTAVRFKCMSGRLLYDVFLAKANGSHGSMSALGVTDETVNYMSTKYSVSTDAPKNCTPSRTVTSFWDGLREGSEKRSAYNSISSDWAGFLSEKSKHHVGTPGEIENVIDEWVASVEACVSKREVLGQEIEFIDDLVTFDIQDAPYHVEGKSAMVHDDNVLAGGPPYPSHFKRSNDRASKSWNDVLGKGMLQTVWVLGSAGQGKTAMLQWMAMQSTKEKKRADQIPEIGLFVRMDRLWKECSHNVDVPQAILNAVSPDRSSTCSKDQLRKGAGKGIGIPDTLKEAILDRHVRIALFLDAVDEVPLSVRRSKSFRSWMKQLLSWSGSSSEGCSYVSRLVISSRYGAFDTLDQNKHSVACMGLLSPSNELRLVHAITEDAEVSEKTVNLLRRTSICRTPLLVILHSALVDANGVDQPLSLYGVYEQIIRLLIKRNLEEKAAFVPEWEVYRHYCESHCVDHILDVYSLVAAAMHLKGGMDMDGTVNRFDVVLQLELAGICGMLEPGLLETEVAWSRSPKYSGVDSQNYADILVAWVIDSLGFILTSTSSVTDSHLGDVIMFSHRTMQEFLCARAYARAKIMTDCSKPLSGLKMDAIQFLDVETFARGDTITSQWWDNVRMFLGSITRESFTNCDAVDCFLYDLTANVSGFELLTTFMFSSQDLFKSYLRRIGQRDFKDVEDLGLVRLGIIVSALQSFTVEIESATDEKFEEVLSLLRKALSHFAAKSLRSFSEFLQRFSNPRRLVLLLSKKLDGRSSQCDPILAGDPPSKGYRGIPLEHMGIERLQRLVLDLKVGTVRMRDLPGPEKWLVAQIAVDLPYEPAFHALFLQSSTGSIYADEWTRYRERAISDANAVPSRVHSSFEGPSLRREDSRPTSGSHVDNPEDKETDDIKEEEDSVTHPATASSAIQFDSSETDSRTTSVLVSSVGNPSSTQPVLKSSGIKSNGQANTSPPKDPLKELKPYWKDFFTILGDIGDTHEKRLLKELIIHGIPAKQYEEFSSKMSELWWHCVLDEFEVEQSEDTNGQPVLSVEVKERLLDLVVGSIPNNDSSHLGFFDGISKLRSWQAVGAVDTPYISLVMSWLTEPIRQKDSSSDSYLKIREHFASWVARTSSALEAANKSDTPAVATDVLAVAERIWVISRSFLQLIGPNFKAVEPAIHRRFIGSRGFRPTDDLSSRSEYNADEYDTLSKVTPIDGVLDCSGMGLRKFLVAGTHLADVRKLILGRYQLRELPDSISGSLDFESNNQLSALPESIGQLTSLSELVVSNNQLSALPESIGQLTSLSELVVSNNQLSTLPESIGQLPSLSKMDVSGNTLSALPEWIGQLTSLSELGVSHNQLSALPESIGQLTLLSALNVSHNQISALPESIGQLTSLSELNVSHSQLSTLPESIGQLTSLSKLDVSGSQLFTLPESIGQLTSLSELNVSHSQLFTLPESIGQLTSLSKLDVSGSQLSALPESIGQLTSLSELNVSHSQLSALPESIGQLTSLSKLVVYRNQLSTLPEWIGQLSSLSKLDVSGNQLSAFPESIGQLTSLSELVVSNNQLSTLPEWIGQLSSLSKLDISGNTLSKLSGSIGQLTSLSKLDVSGNTLSTLPESIGQLTSLSKLDVSGNQLSALPESIGQLISLSKLVVCRNQLSTLPESIGQLTSLSELDVSGNQLSALPESIGQLISLSKLVICRNRLSALPESIGQLTSLSELDVPGNQLCALPESIGQLTSLSKLVVCRNRLSALPESIGQLTSLSELDVSKNPLTDLPHSLGELNHLHVLDVGGNPCTSIPREVLLSPTTELLAFLRARGCANDNRHSEQPITRLMLLGEGAVGKTSMIRRCIFGKPKLTKETERTFGMEICRLDVCNAEGQVVHCRVCNCAGQPMFYPQHELFLMTRSIYLLCHPLKETNSMVPFEGWLDELKARTKEDVSAHGQQEKQEILALIVLTKSDLVSEKDAKLKVQSLLQKARSSNSMLSGVHAVSSAIMSKIDGIDELQRDIASLALRCRWSKERLGPKIRSVEQCALDWYRGYESIRVPESHDPKEPEYPLIEKVSLWTRSLLPAVGGSSTEETGADPISSWLDELTELNIDEPVVPWNVFLKHCSSHPQCEEVGVSESDILTAVRILHRMGSIVILPFSNDKSSMPEYVVLSGHWLSVVVLPHVLEAIDFIAPHGYVDRNKLSLVLKYVIPTSVLDSVPEVLMHCHLMFHESVFDDAIVTPLSFSPTPHEHMAWPPQNSTEASLKQYAFQLSYVPRSFLTLFFRELYRCGTVSTPWQGQHGVNGKELLAGGCIFNVVESSNPTRVLLDWERRRVSVEHVDGDHCAAIAVLVIVDRLIKYSFPGVTISVVCPNDKCPYPIPLMSILSQWEAGASAFHGNQKRNPGCGLHFEISRVLPESSTLYRLPIFPGDLKQESSGPLMAQLLRLRDSQSQRTESHPSVRERSRRPSIFISFSGEERHTARLLKERIDRETQSQIDVFLDEDRNENRGLQVRLDINSQLIQHLWTCSVGICLLSVSYIQKSAPLMELDVLWRRRCRGENGVLVPLFHHTLPPEMCKRSVVSGVEELAGEALTKVSHTCGEVWSQGESSEQFVSRVTPGIITHVQSQLNLYDRNRMDD